MKHLIEQQEIDNVVHMYFAHMQGRYFIEMLKSFSQGRGYGMESTCCIFSFEYQPSDEEYFGDNGVQISRTFPNEEFVILTYEEFFKRLSEVGCAFVDKHPERKQEVEEYLVTIGNRLHRM